MPLIPPVDYLFLIIIHNDNHPNTHLAVTGIQRRTVDPTITAVRAETCHPFDGGCDTAPVHHRLDEVFLDGGGIVDSGHE